MTADTETIREALEEMCPYLERKVASFPDDGFARLRFERAAAALAVLGRVEERERALTEALTRIGHRVYGPNDALALAHDYERIARAALAGSVAEGEQERS